MPSAGATIKEVTIVHKLADTDIQNDNTLSADPHLVLSIAANEILLVQVSLFIEAPAAGAGGFQASLAGPAAPVNVVGGTHYVGSVPGNTNGRIIHAYGQSLHGGCNDLSYYIHALIENGVNSGDLYVTIAQSVVHVDITTLLRGSSMTIHRF